MKIASLGTGFLGRQFAKQATAHDLWLTKARKEGIEELKEISPRASVMTHRDLDQLKELIDWCDVLVVTISPDYIEVAEAVAKLISPQKRLIYSSSTGVYGEEIREVDESSAIEPNTERQKILYGAESIYLSLPNPVTILRFGGIVGLGRKIRGEEKGKNLVHVEDAARVILFVIDNQLTGIYNVSKPLFFDENRELSHSKNKRVSSAKLIREGFQWNHLK